MLSLVLWMEGLPELEEDSSASSSAGSPQPESEEREDGPERENGAGSFLALGDDIHFHWLQFLTLEELSNLRLVSKDCSYVVSESILWDNLYRLVPRNDWVDAFVSLQELLSAHSTLKRGKRRKRSSSSSLAAVRLYSREDCKHGRWPRPEEEPTEEVTGRWEKKRKTAFSCARKQKGHNLMGGRKRDPALPLVPLLPIHRRVVACHLLARYGSSVESVVCNLYTRLLWPVDTIVQFLSFFYRQEYERDRERKEQQERNGLSSSSCSRVTLDCTGLLPMQGEEYPWNSLKNGHLLCNAASGLVALGALPEYIARSLVLIGKSLRDQLDLGLLYSEVAQALYSSHGANMSVEEIAKAMHSKAGAALSADDTACALLRANFPMEVVAWALHNQKGAGMTLEDAAAALFHALAALDAVVYSLYVKGGVGLHPSKIAKILFRLNSGGLRAVARALFLGARLSYKQTACSMFAAAAQHGYSPKDVASALAEACYVSTEDAESFVEGLVNSHRILSAHEFSTSMNQLLNGVSA